jgi:hypothetical protein
MVGFLAPLWFPILQRLVSGQFLSVTEWLILLIFLVSPIWALWQCEKQEKKDRISEQMRMLREVFKEAGLIKK